MHHRRSQARDRVRTYTDDAQSCRWCHAMLYRVPCWRAEMDRLPDTRQWFCGRACFDAWFQSVYG